MNPHREVGVFYFIYFYYLCVVMKLYAEKQVIEMIEKSRKTGLTAEYLILTTPPIEILSDEQKCVEFAKWIAKSEWMSIWVEDKWMWECQLDNSNTSYVTDEELYNMYLLIQGGKE